MLIKSCSELLKDLQLSHFELLLFEALGITKWEVSVRNDEKGLWKLYRCWNAKIFKEVKRVLKCSRLAALNLTHTFPSMLLLYTKLTHLSIIVRVKATKNELILFKGVLLKTCALLLNNSFIWKSFWELAFLSLLVISFNWKPKWTSCFMTELLDSLRWEEIKSCFSWISIPNYSIKAESQDV